jgi:release factor glutamine methyltransferase
LPLKIKQVIKNAITKLERPLGQEAFLDALILLEYILKKDRSWILAHDEEIINKKDLLAYNKLITKRANLWPVAYLTGEKYFYGYKFLVNKNVLIPRPESELIIETILPLLNKKTVLIDLGTGSGCLIISLLLQNKNLKQAIAIDISSLALKVAKQNARNYGLSKKITFIKSDLLKNINFKKLDNNNIIIMANLPYLKPSEMKEPSIKHEPKQALVAGTDGLKYYRELASQLKNICQKTILICEINPGQKNGFKKIFPKTEFRKDLSKKIRLGIIKM